MRNPFSCVGQANQAILCRDIKQLLSEVSVIEGVGILRCFKGKGEVAHAILGNGSADSGTACNYKVNGAHHRRFNSVFLRAQGAVALQINNHLASGAFLDDFHKVFKGHRNSLIPARLHWRTAR